MPQLHQPQPAADRASFLDALADLLARLYLDGKLDDLLGDTDDDEGRRVQQILH